MIKPGSNVCLENFCRAKLLTNSSSWVTLIANLLGKKNKSQQFLQKVLATTSTFDGAKEVSRAS
jgi:hypothetical protein